MVKNLDTIVNLCKSRGVIFAGSEIYGGMGNTWDYGPVGVEIKNNIKRMWWKRFVQENDNSFGVDAAILMNPRVWEASGHVASFNDPLVDCKVCKKRLRADNLVDDFAEKHKIQGVIADLMSNSEMDDFIAEHKVKCPNCGNADFTKIRQFGLMFETSRGVTEENQNKIYLRPETAQGEFVNYLNIQRSSRAKLPFGIAQIGKAFRNEITPGNFTFRSIEFEQMEHQLFCKPEDGEKFFNEYKAKAKQFLLDLGIKEENLRFHDHDKLAHYALAATDIEYRYPMGFKELNGIHNRSAYDLTQHEKFSGKSMLYTDAQTGETCTPNVIENSIGADRLALAVLCEAYDEEILENGETRVVLHLHPSISAYKVAVLPLQKNLSEKATEILAKLKKYFMCVYDEAGSIGKRYRRQDEIGTPFCVTIDFDTLDDDTVTIRERDTMAQIRIKVCDLVDYIQKAIQF